MAAGTDPNAARCPQADGPTLREALEFHIQRMESGENRRRKRRRQAAPGQPTLLI